MLVVDIRLMLVLMVKIMMGLTMPRKTKTAMLATREMAATTPATIRFSRIANIFAFPSNSPLISLLTISYLFQRFEFYFLTMVSRHKNKELPVRNPIPAFVQF